jgi:Transposase DDE domain group 1
MPFWRTAYLIIYWGTTLLAALAEAYDDRAMIEAEMKADKGGLQLHRRRKKRLAAQEALVLLTDLAHNLLAWSRGWMFRDSPFAEAGIYRIVKELFPIPGKVTVEEGQIVKLRLKASHPFAKPMLACLTRLFDRF